MSGPGTDRRGDANAGCSHDGFGDVVLADIGGGSLANAYVYLGSSAGLAAAPATMFSHTGYFNAAAA